MFQVLFNEEQAIQYLLMTIADRTVKSLLLAITRHIHKCSIIQKNLTKPLVD